MPHLMYMNERDWFPGANTCYSNDSKHRPFIRTSNLTNGESLVQKSLNDEVANDSTWKIKSTVVHATISYQSNRSLPSYMCILGPQVLNILATLTSTSSFQKHTQTLKIETKFNHCHESVSLSLYLFSVGIGHCLWYSFPLVVAGSGTNGVDVPPIFLHLRVNLHTYTRTHTRK